jgi:hypothetical protein
METDVYVFAREATPDLVSTLEERGDQRLRYVALTTGAHAAFAVVELDDIQALNATLEEVFGNPLAHGLETAVPVLPGTDQIRWTKQYAYSAFTRIRTRPGRASEVLGVTATLPGYNGSAIVAGAFDVLVEFGADDDDELKRRLLHGLQGIRGIASSDTSIVSQYYYRGPRKQPASS